MIRVKRRRLRRLRRLGRIKIRSLRRERRREIRRHRLTLMICLPRIKLIMNLKQRRTRELKPKVKAPLLLTVILKAAQVVARKRIKHK